VEKQILRNKRKRLINLIQYCPSLKQEIITKKYKGEGLSLHTEVSKNIQG